MDTQLIAVTVYPDRARLIRMGHISVEVGTQQVAIQDLPLVLIPDSLRSAARGTAQARLLGLRLQRAFYTETPVERVRELEAQLETAQDELDDIDVQIGLVRSQSEKLDSLAGQSKIYSKALAGGQTSLEAQIALFRGLRDQVGALNVEMGGLRIRRREQERRVQKLQNELQQLKSASPRERYTAYIDLDVSKSGDLTVELSYVVNRAGWEPLYDLRYSEQEHQPQIEVGYIAQVRQQTGEYWQGVKLSLSTARPALVSQLPELDPWYIQPLPPPIPLEKGRMTREVAMEQAAPMFAMAAPDREILEAQTALAEVVSSGASVTYQITHPVDVPSDGEPHKVAITSYALKPRLDYVTAPKIVQAAYRRVKVVNESAYTLLPGVANLFVEDEFIGTTRIELTPTGGEIEQYLGVDDRIRVSRELKRREVDKVLIGGKRRLRYAYQIELENLNDVEVPLTLNDQIPLGRHEAIKVRLEATDPKTTQQDELNMLTWELLLAPKAKVTVRFDFSVEHPPEMEVVGLA